MRTELLAELSNAHGTSGREEAIADDRPPGAGARRSTRIETDPLGGLCGIREPADRGRPASRSGSCSPPIWTRSG